MAKTPIGKPIPVGDLSSLTEELSSPAVAENTSSVIEHNQPEPVVMGTMPALAENIQAAPTASEAFPVRGWADLMEMSWRLALLPTMIWSTYMEASWKAWENAAQPQWLTR